MDIPFLGMSPDACLSTSCPIEAGQKNTYHVEVPILKKYPVVSRRNYVYICICKTIYVAPLVTYCLSITFQLILLQVHFLTKFLIRYAF